MGLKWWLLFGVVAVPVVVVVAFAVWASITPSLMPEAVAALESDDVVLVEDDPWLLFRPVVSPSPVGFVLYPGGKVKPGAYAPAARAIAAEGYVVVVPAMPLNLAVFAPEVALEVQAALPEVERWVVGGHSLGGSMAAQFAFNQPEQVSGLVLWASYPAEGSSLRGAQIPVVSIYGSVDGLTTVADVEASGALLPLGTQWVEIVEGNHAQFGWYGPQGGDNVGMISRADQQAQVVAATVALLEAVGN